MHRKLQKTVIAYLVGGLRYDLYQSSLIVCFGTTGDFLVDGLASFATVFIQFPKNRETVVVLMPCGSSIVANGNNLGNSFGQYFIVIVTGGIDFPSSFSPNITGTEVTVFSGKGICFLRIIFYLTHFLYC